ncbi:Ribosomal RNA small subunit methyltransferase G [Burkholderiales bacterium]|nr:Ribosomal RNA small subunit methyltransferase G [Burkholderiales bacterium]
MGHGNLPPDPSAASGAAVSPALLGELAAELGLELTPQQCAALVAYAALLQRWNRVHNLTAIASGAQLLTHHLLDCLAIVRPLERALAQQASDHASARPIRFLDAGAGAGLPGIPLAVARPHWHGTLVDAVEKKCAFLRQARLELHLANLTVRHARLESCALEPQELIVSRAFASLRDFVCLTRPLLRPDGLWAAMKGRKPLDEIADLPPGVELVDTITLRVPMLREQRHLVLLRLARQHQQQPEQDSQQH